MKLSEMSTADANAYNAHKASRKMTNKHKDIDKQVKVWQLHVLNIDSEQIDNAPIQDFYNETYSLIIAMGFSRRKANTNRELINWVAEAYSLYLARNAVQDILSQLEEEVGGNISDSELSITDIIKDGIEKDSEWNTRLYKWGADLNGSLIALWLGGVMGGKITATAFNKLVEKFTNHAELIMKNESARVYATNQYRKYKSDGVTHVVWEAQTGACKLCMPLDGKRMTLREADGKIPMHPYCRCVIIPVKED